MKWVVALALVTRFFAAATDDINSNTVAAYFDSAMAVEQREHEVAGYIVQRISGMPWEDYVERRLLAPLGMNHTSLRQPLPESLAPPRHWLQIQRWAMGCGPINNSLPLLLLNRTVG